MNGFEWKQTKTGTLATSNFQPIGMHLSREQWNGADGWSFEAGQSRGPSHHARKQELQCDKTNKELAPSKMVIFFFFLFSVFSQWVHCSPTKRFSFTCLTTCKGPITSTQLRTPLMQQTTLSTSVLCRVCSRKSPSRHTEQTDYPKNKIDSFTGEIKYIF